MDIGGLCVMMGGITMMQQWFANSWVSPDIVSHLYAFPLTYYSVLILLSRSTSRSNCLLCATSLI